MVTYTQALCHHVVHTAKRTLKVVGEREERERERERESQARSHADGGIRLILPLLPN